MMPPYKRNNLASALGTNESSPQGRSQSAPKYLILRTQDLPEGCAPGDSFLVKVVSMNGEQSVGMIDDSSEKQGSKDNPIWIMTPESPTP